jgi:hypothetical protein
MNIFLAPSVLGLELKAIYRGVSCMPAISLGSMRLVLGLN